MFIPTPTFIFKNKPAGWCWRSGTAPDAPQLHSGQPWCQWAGVRVKRWSWCPCLPLYTVESSWCAYLLTAEWSPLRSASKSSTGLSRHEAGSRNQQHNWHSTCSAGQCRWLPHATSKFSESESGSICFYSILHSPRLNKWPRLNNRLWAWTGACIFFK